MYIGIFLFFRFCLGVSILYVEKTEEVEVCLGVPSLPGEGRRWWSLILCFIVVVLVIVWGIILGDTCERGSVFIVSVV